jgi:hypothetical protein
MTACQRRLPGGTPSWRQPCDGESRAARYGAAPISQLKIAARTDAAAKEMQGATMRGYAALIAAAIETTDPDTIAVVEQLMRDDTAASSITSTATGSVLLRGRQPATRS